MNTRRALILFVTAIAGIIAAPTSLRAADEKIWHVKAIHPEGRLLDVKAIDKDGKIHGIKAIEADGNVHLLDIKAMVGESRLPVKVLPKAAGDMFEPVKAIGEDGTVFAIKALTPEGAKLDVKGVKRSGNIIHIKAVAADGTFYGIKAISSEGRVYDVKGIKMNKESTEGKVSGVDFAAHIKAIPQAPSN